MSYKTKAFLLLALAAVVVFFVSREEDRGNLASAERTYIDWLIGNSKKKVLTPSVTLLRIGGADKTILQRWPPGPIDYSIMLRRLKLYGPKVIAAEPPLRWEDVDEGELEVLRSAGLQFERGQLLLGAVLQRNPAAEPPRDSTLSMLQPLPEVGGDLSAVPEFTNILSLPDPRLTSAGAPVGFTAIDLGDESQGGDSLLVPLLAKIGETVVPSFVLLAAMLELDAAPGDVAVVLGERIVIKGELTIPIDASGALNVFTGLRPVLPVREANILVWDPDDDSGGPGGGLGKDEREALASRVVLLGLDDEGSRSVPAGGGLTISRAELFALAIATIQSGRHLEKVSPAAGWAVAAGLALAGLLVLLPRRGRAIGLALLLAMLYFAGNMLLFQGSQRWVPPAVPVAILGCVLLVALMPGDGGRGRTPDPDET